MNDFEEIRKRLAIENDELLDKIDKIGYFFSNDKATDIGTDQLMLLEIQLDAMNTYRKCLTARIDRL